MSIQSAAMPINTIAFWVIWWKWDMDNISVPAGTKTNAKSPSSKDTAKLMPNARTQNQQASQKLRLKAADWSKNNLSTSQAPLSTIKKVIDYICIILSSAFIFYPLQSRHANNINEEIIVLSASAHFTLVGPIC